MFYQALVGAWPAQPLDAPIPAAADHAVVERMQRYMRKALKEAKRHTGWLHENREYEEGVSLFVQCVLARELAPLFLASFLPFQRRLAWFGMLGSLAQLVVRLGSPGVPDVYQGSELWNFSLVDPDNRAPVDFDQRRAMLAELEPLLAQPMAQPSGDGALQVSRLLENWHDGRVKLFTLATGLRLRRAYPDLFLYGDYEPLGTDGDEPHLIAFSRRHGAEELIVVVPRFVATMLRGATTMPLGIERWRTASTRLPRRLAGTRLLNVFTGEVITPAVYRDVPWLLASSVFQTFPVAMLRVATG
jgi:(1->4)-alpha-D-glucan 1-alpha-D-glucosylmutase